MPYSHTKCIALIIFVWVVWSFKNSICFLLLFFNLFYFTKCSSYSTKSSDVIHLFFEQANWVPGSALFLQQSFIRMLLKIIIGGTNSGSIYTTYTCCGQTPSTTSNRARSLWIVGRPVSSILYIWLTVNLYSSNIDSYLSKYSLKRSLLNSLVLAIEVISGVRRDKQGWSFINW